MPLINVDEKLGSAAVATDAITEAAKKEARAKKFGAAQSTTSPDKLETRAKRFNNGKSEQAPPPSKETLDKRAERFGATATADAKTTTSPENKSEALEKRAKRFGAGAAEPVADEKVLKRKERFAIVNEDDKKKQRSERFEKV